MELEFIERRQCWRGDRVYYFDEAGIRSGNPTEWTPATQGTGRRQTCQRRVRHRPETTAPAPRFPMNP
ncbi:DUF5372 family protein [Streptomyces sp. NPDC002513]